MGGMALMNKTRKSIALWFMVMMGLPVACNVSQEPNKQAPDVSPAWSQEKVEGSGEFAGTYHLVTIDDHAVPYAPVHEGHQAPQIVSSILTLNGDGKFISTMKYGETPNLTGSRDFKGTYTREGSGLTLSWEGAGQTNVTLEGDKITMNNEGMFFVYQR